MNQEQGRDFENLIKEDKNNDKEREVLDRNKRQEIKNETEIKEEEGKLEIFSDAIGDVEYYICGGMGVELAEGAIKHKHGDIDIIVFEDDLEKIKENLGKKGFAITPGRGWGGHTLDAMNYELDEESDEPKNKEDVHIGIFVYKKDNDHGIVQQIEPDGSINKEFPLKYFNKEKQTIDYKNSKLIVADLRLSAGFKVASDREKDIKDIERIGHIFKSKYTKVEIEELKDVVKNNVETLFNASIKHIFTNFLQTNQEITGENIHKYFDQEFEEKIAGIEDFDYANIVKDFIVSLRDFSSTAEGYEEIKKEFLAFAFNKLKPTTDYYKNIVDKTLE